MSGMYLMQTGTHQKVFNELDTLLQSQLDHVENANWWNVNRYWLIFDIVCGVYIFFHSNTHIETHGYSTEEFLRVLAATNAPKSVQNVFHAYNKTESVDIEHMMDDMLLFVKQHV